MAVADRHDLASLTASSRANGSAPFFCPGERGVDEGFGQIDLAAVSQVFGESLEQDLKASGSLPQAHSDGSLPSTAIPRAARRTGRSSSRGARAAMPPSVPPPSAAA